MQSCESFFFSFPLMCLSKKAALISCELYIQREKSLYGKHCMTMIESKMRSQNESVSTSLGHVLVDDFNIALNNIKREVFQLTLNHLS